MSLETQVGHASDLIAGRGTSSDLPEDKLKAVADKVDEIYKKLERLQTKQLSNNIVINSCHAGQAHFKEQSSTHTDSSDSLSGDLYPGDLNPGDLNLQQEEAVDQSQTENTL